MAWTTALRNIAGNIDEIGPFTTFGASLRWLCGCYKKSAFGAFPVGQTTVRTNIVLEPTVGGVATMCTDILLGVVFHFFYIFSKTYPYVGRYRVST